jgi:hypothetical protein
VPIGRWISWVPLATLLVLTAGAAVWSVSSSPQASMGTSASVDTTPPGARLTATPTIVLVGQPVQLSGTDCPRRDEVLTGITAPVIPDRDGSWKLDEPVGITNPVGQQDFGAYCFRRGGRTMVFSYPTVHVRVSMSPPPGARLRVRPTTLMIGRPVHLSGTDCPYGDQAETDYGDASPDAKGSWSFAGEVDQSSPIGFVPVGAECVSIPNKYEVFSYRPIMIEVDTFRHLRVTPGTTVPAGAVLTIFSVGACPTGGSIYGYVAEVSLSDGPPSHETVVSADSDQNEVSGLEWSSTLAIPEGVAPGHYELSATCELSRVVPDGSYSPVPITITAG